MLTIAWILFLAILIASAYLRGISLGLLSSLLLACLVFSRYVQPTSLPIEWVLLQSAGLILAGTLDASNFWISATYWVQQWIDRECTMSRFFFPFISYFLTFLTGDLAWMNQVRLPSTDKGVQSTSIAAKLATYMALPATPYTFSGLLLLWTMINHGEYALCFTKAMFVTGLSSTYLIYLMVYFLPKSWLKKCFFLIVPQQKCAQQSPVKLNKESIHCHPILALGLLWLMLLLCTLKKTAPIQTYFMNIRQLPIPLSWCMALMCFGFSGIVMLFFAVKPASIIQSIRFKRLVGDFFQIFGVIWLLSTLLQYDNLSMFTHPLSLSHYGWVYGLYLAIVVVLPMPFAIWLMMPLLQNCSIPLFHLAVLLTIAALLSQISKILWIKWIKYLKD